MMKDTGMTTADVLDATADVLVETGWCQGSSSVFDEKGNAVGHCTLGALSRVVSDNWSVPRIAQEWVPTVDFISSFLGVRSVPKWNDAPERTQDEVVQALRDAATKQRML